MSPSSLSDPSGVPDFEGETEALYTVEILARLSGVSSETILLYHERGLLHPSAGPVPDLSFDDESLRRLRRLESLREAGGMNLSGLCLVARLLDEIDDLRNQLRGRR
jgi:MerR family transcriptional regulator/heat shock protein HspR